MTPPPNPLWSLLLSGWDVVESVSVIDWGRDIKIQMLARRDSRYQQPDVQVASTIKIPYRIEMPHGQIPDIDGPLTEVRKVLYAELWVKCQQSPMPIKVLDGARKQLR